MKYATCLAVVLSLLSCSRNIEGKPVGDLTISEAVDLYSTHPTIMDWLTKTNAMPRYLPKYNCWQITLKDGAMMYTEERIKGELFVNEIGCDPDDQRVKDVLNTEYAKHFGHIKSISK